MGTVFGGDVLNNASPDETNILDQMYKSKYYLYDDFNSSYHYTKMHTNTKVALNPKFMSVVFLEYTASSITLKV